MKFLGNGAVFVVLYLLFMLPTYFLPYLGSNSAGMMAIQGADSAQGGTLALTYLHLSCLALLIIITWFRAKLVGKTWLIIFPILAATFDFVPGLSAIPLVPTVMHLLAIILGVSSSVVAAPTSSSSIES